MSEIDDIFARLGGGRLAKGDQRDRRDIPRRGKAAGSRVVEVVHVTTGRPAVSPAVTRRNESGVRAQTWESGFPTQAAPHPSSSPAQQQAAKAPAPVGHVVARWKPVADVAADPPSPPAPVDVQPRPIDAPTVRVARSDTRQKARPVADPFDPQDDRANCLRCGYVVEPDRDRRGLMTCAACAR